MDFPYKLNGVIASNPTASDFTLKNVLKGEGQFPEQYSIYFPYFYCQGTVEGCGAMSGKAFATWNRWKKTGIYTELSHGMLYGIRLSDGYKGPGIIDRELFSVMRKYGIPPFKLFPFWKEVPDIINLAEQYKDSLAPYAAENCIAAYGRLLDKDEVKLAHANKFGVFYCLDIYESFKYPDKDGVVPIPDPSREKLLGGHMVWGTGWNTQNFDEIDNWWKDWGVNGRGYLPSGYPIKAMWFAVPEFDNDDSDENEPVDIVINSIVKDTVIGVESAREYMSKNFWQIAKDYYGKTIKFVREKDGVILDQFIVPAPDTNKYEIYLAVSNREIKVGEKTTITAILRYEGNPLPGQVINIGILTQAHLSDKPANVQLPMRTNSNGIVELDYGLDVQKTVCVVADHIDPSGKKHIANPICFNIKN